MARITTPWGQTPDLGEPVQVMPMWDGRVLTFYREPTTGAKIAYDAANNGFVQLATNPEYGGEEVVGWNPAGGERTGMNADESYIYSPPVPGFEQLTPGYTEYNQQAFDARMAAKGDDGGFLGIDNVLPGFTEGALPLLSVMGAGVGLSNLLGAGAGAGAGATSGAGAFGAPTAAEMAAATAADATAFTPASLSAVAAAEGLPLAGAAGVGAGAAGMSALEQELSKQVLEQQGQSLLTGGAAGTGIGLGAAATGATGLSSLKNILDNGGSVDDWLNIVGKAAPGIIGAFGASEQADAIRDVGDKEDARIREFMTLGAPSRDRYEASFEPGFDITSDPALRGAMDTTTDTLLRRLSATGGNPYGNPGGLMEAEKYVMGNVALPYLQNYRNQNASTGGYGAFNTTAAGGGDTTKLNLAGINADAGILGGLGDAASSIFTPRSSLDQLLKQLQGYGLGTNLA